MGGKFEPFCSHCSPMGSGGKILYIEDNTANLRLVDQIISLKTEHALLKAETAPEGIKLALQESPDLILLDINLPGMNGYDALKILKADPQTKDIPVAAISANAMDSDIEQGMSSGFIEYITKPINIHALLAFLDQFFSKK